MDRLEEIKKLITNREAQIKETQKGKIEISYTDNQVKISVTTYEETKN